MKIIVLGGSPKGETSVTMQYVEYLKRRYPEVTFDVQQPAAQIRRLESNKEAFEEIIAGVAAADGVLWAFPLYVHGVCSQYQRFIELIEERNAAGAFAGKVAASLSTSIHFFDNTAHDYVRSVCEDLGMAYALSHSPKMDDLVKPEGRKAAEGFFELFRQSIQNGLPATQLFPSRSETSEFRYTPGKTATIRSESGRCRCNHTENDSAAEPVAAEVKIAIVADSLEGNLAGMIERFRSNFAGGVTVINLRDINIAGGCLGCLKCGPANRCGWDGKDDLRSVYEEYIETADIYVLAGTVKGRWHSSELKAFIDRGFYHTHQPFLTGKQFAVLLDGPITTNPALRDFCTSYPEWQGAGLQGIAATDSRDSKTVDADIDALAGRCAMAVKTGYQRPKTFLGVGGMDIFRDDIYGHLGMVFRADHKSYRKNGVYKTMPHKRPLKFVGLRIVNLIVSFPPIRKKISANMRTFMLTPYKMMFKSLGMDSEAEDGSAAARKAGK